MAEFKPNAESFRLLALTSLASKDLIQARFEIRKALELEPRWDSVRYTEGMIYYFSALAIPAIPDQIVPWPEPVDWSLVKRDDEAIGYLRRAAGTFKDLAEGQKDTREQLETWYLAALLNDAERHEEAIEQCRGFLKTDPTNFRIIAWAVARQLSVDLGPSEVALKSLLETDVAKIPHVLALLSCQLARHRGADAIVVLDNTKTLFDVQKATQLWSFWYAQSLVVAGDPQAALKVIDDLHADSEANTARTVVLKALAKSSGNSAELLAHLHSSYEETKDPTFILEACKLKGYENDWTYVAARADLLMNDIGTADAVRLAIIAAFNADQFNLCLALLDKGRKAFSKEQLPNELRRLRALTYHKLGTLPAAVIEAESLVQEEPTVQNILALAQICFEKGDFKRLAVVARRLNDRSDLSAEQLLRIARLIQVEDRDLAVTLWRRSLQRELQPTNTAMAISLGYQLGLDEELRPLLGKMAVEAASGIGPVKLVNFADLISLREHQRVQSDKYSEMYRQGSVPIHLIVDAGNIPLPDLYHRLLTDNELKQDPLHTPGLFVRHGGRSLSSGFPSSVPEWHLNVDITSILLAEHLEILDDVAKVFKPSRFSAKLIPTLVELRDQILHEQPSRVKTCREVLGLENSGKLKTIECTFVPTEQNELLASELGGDWVSLFETARDTNGFLVDVLPLTKLNLSGPPSALPADADNVIINCRSIVEALRQYGPLTRDDYLETLKTLGQEGDKPSANVPPEGSILYCEGAIPEMLSTAGILETVCIRFDVRIQKRELERLKSEIRSYDLRNTLAQWLTDLLHRLRDGLDNGIFEVIPLSSKPESETQPGTRSEPHGLTTACLTDLVTFPVRDHDVLWIDDRHINAYSHRDGATIVTICEILKVLVGAGALQASDYYRKIASLRASNVKFIPVESEELVYQLNQAEIDVVKRALIETQSLAALRRYVATSLLQVDIPQWPPMPKGVPNEAGELNFFVSLGRAITTALIELWKSSAENGLRCELQSEWIIANLFQEHLGLNNPSFQQRTDADYQYIVSLRLADLISASLSLDQRNQADRVSTRKQYLNWLHKNILQTRFEANPYLVASVAEVIKNSLFRIDPDFDNRYPRQVAIATLQKFFADLPDEIHGELLKDTDFLVSLGLKSEITISFEDVVFQNRAFCEAVASAMNGNDCAIQSLIPKSEVVFKPSRGQTGFPAVSFTHPLNNRRIVLDDDISRLTTRSTAEREVILRRNPQWFDESDDVIAQEVAKIASVEDVVNRIDEAKSWSDSSASVYYSSLKRNLATEPKFKPDDLIPPNAQGLLRRLRIPLNVDGEKPFHNLFETAAHKLLHDEGLQIAIERLWGIPTPIPMGLVTTLRELPDTDKRTFVKKLLRSARSPISLIHLLYLVMAISEKAPSYRRLARLLVRKITNESNVGGFEVFKSIIAWVNDEFGHRQDFQSLSSRLRLALAWSHSDVLFTILVSAGAPVDWLRDKFASMINRVPHELFHRDPNYWFDIAHPRQVNRTTLILSGLSYGLGNEARSVFDSRLQTWLRTEVFQTVESERLPVLSLLRDSTLAFDCLDSFLAGDRGPKLSSLLDSDEASISKDTLATLTKNALQRLKDQPDDFRSWTLIVAIMGDMPPYAEVIPDLIAVIKNIRFSQLFEKDPKLATYLLLAATGWASNVGDQDIKRHLNEQITKVCELQAQSNAFSLTNEVKMVCLEAALNLSRSMESAENILPNFASLVKTMVDILPTLISDFRPLVERFVNELPLTQARHLYPLLLRLRAA